MKNRNDLKNYRRKDATERNTAWAKLSPQDQVNELDKRLGKGVGALKQRAKLQKLIEKDAVQE